MRKIKFINSIVAHAPMRFKTKAARFLVQTVKQGRRYPCRSKCHDLGERGKPWSNTMFSINFCCGPLSLCGSKTVYVRKVNTSFSAFHWSIKTRNVYCRMKWHITHCVCDAYVTVWVSLLLLRVPTVLVYCLPLQHGITSCEM